MSINYTIRQNENARTLNYSLTMGGNAVDLSTATSVDFIINNGDNIFNRTATIVSAPSGSVSYDLVLEDTAKAGVMYCNFKITYNDNTVLYVPTVGHIAIDVKTNSENLDKTSGL